MNPDCQSPLLKTNLRILVVDDNEAIHEDFRKILAPDNAEDSALDAEDAELFGDSSRCLTRRTAFELAFATQGQKAVELVTGASAANQPFAVAFIDVRMPPGMDGFDTTLKMWAVAPDLQVVICTAHSDKSWEEMAEKLQHHDRVLILKKPFDSIEVLQLAHALTEKWSLHEALKLHMQSLEQSVASRTQELTAEVEMHKRSQERVRELGELLDKAHDAIMMTDADDHIVYWNKGAERVYGWTAAEVINKDPGKLLTKPGTSQSGTRRVAMEQGEWTGERSHQTKDGRTVLIECRWTILYDAQGAPKARLGIHTDITERRRLTDQILRMQRMESIGTLASGVAHDLNNALSPIMLGVELLRLRLPDDSNNALLGTMEISAQRGREIVRQILTFASGAECERVATSVADLIHEQEKLCRNTFYKLIEIQTSVPDDLWPVTADVTQLHQVLMNLCVNARDAMPSGGRLTIGAENTIFALDSIEVQSGRNPGPYVTITVSDTGSGIPPEIMDRIFDPFFTTKSRDKGTGLGLSTVLGVVQNHGGFIEAESEPDSGTTFRVFIPAYGVPDPSPPPVRQAPVPPVGGHECVLVVDDEQTIRQMVKTTLEIHGYEVLLARSGEDAVALFQQHPDDIAVVITDLAMPGLDGHATIAALQQIRTEVNVIAMSGGLSKAPKGPPKGHAGNVSMLHKPFTSDALLKALLEALKSRTLAVAEPI